MKEVVFLVTDTPGPKTYFRGKDPINSIWIFLDLEILSANYLLVHVNIRDNQPVVAKILLTLILGQGIKRIVPAKGWHMNAKNRKLRDR